MCKGANKETYHIACVIQKEGGKAKQRVQTFSQSLDVKCFTCKVCLKQERKRLKDELANNNMNTSDRLNSDGEDSEEDSPFPLNSLDSQVRKVYEESEENRILDEIIVKEIDQIEKDMAELSLLGRKSRIFKLN